MGWARQIYNAKFQRLRRPTGRGLPRAHRPGDAPAERAGRRPAIPCHVHCGRRRPPRAAQGSPRVKWTFLSGGREAGGAAQTGGRNSSGERASGSAWHCLLPASLAPTSPGTPGDRIGDLRHLLGSAWHRRQQRLLEVRSRNEVGDGRSRREPAVWGGNRSTRRRSRPNWERSSPFFLQ